MTKKKSEMSIGKAAVIGAGVAAMGAGAYYLLGPKGKEHQKKLKALTIEMKKEVDKELKKVKGVTGPLYQNAVDAMATTYSKQYKEHANEINAFAKKLKGEWKSVQQKARPAVKVIKKAKRTVKKAI